MPIHLRTTAGPPRVTVIAAPGAAGCATPAARTRRTELRHRHGRLWADAGCGNRPLDGTVMGTTTPPEAAMIPHPALAAELGRQRQHDLIRAGDHAARRHWPDSGTTVDRQRRPLLSALGRRLRVHGSARPSVNPTV